MHAQMQCNALPNEMMNTGDSNGGCQERAWAFPGSDMLLWLCCKHVCKTL